MLILIFLQSLLVPILLSAVLLYLSLRLQRTYILFVVGSWFIIFSWIKGEVVLIPGEALDWIWILVIIISLFTLITSKKKHLALSSIVFSLFLVIVSWPLLKQPLAVLVLFEIAMFVAISAGTFYSIHRTPAEKPALLIVICSLALAVTVGFGGSLFIAQLAIAVAALIGAFLFLELVGQPTPGGLSVSLQTMFIAIYLSLLFIARTYVEIPIVSTILLALSPSISLLYSSRFYCLFSAVAGGMAILWVLLTTGQTGY